MLVVVKAAVAEPLHGGDVHQVREPHPAVSVASPRPVSKAPDRRRALQGSPVTGRPASASTVTREAAPSASPSPRGSTPVQRHHVAAPQPLEAPVGLADVLLLQRQPLAPARAAAHVAEPPLAGQRLGDDPEDAPPAAARPRPRRAAPAPGSSSSPPPCAGRRRVPIWATSAGGSMARSAWHQSLSLSSAGQAPRKRHGARTARPRATSRSRTRSSAREVSRRAGSITTSEPPGRQRPSRLLEQRRPPGLRPLPLPELVEDVAERDQVGACAAGQLGQRRGVGRVPAPAWRAARPPSAPARGPRPAPAGPGRPPPPRPPRRRAPRRPAAPGRCPGRARGAAGAAARRGRRAPAGRRRASRRAGRPQQPLVVEVAGPGQLPLPGQPGGEPRHRRPPPRAARRAGALRVAAGRRGAAPPPPPPGATPGRRSPRLRPAGRSSAPDRQQAGDPRLELRCCVGGHGPVLPESRGAVSRGRRRRRRPRRALPARATIGRGLPVPRQLPRLRRPARAGAGVPAVRDPLRPGPPAARSACRWPGRRTRRGRPRDGASRRGGRGGARPSAGALERRRGGGPARALAPAAGAPSRAGAGVGAGLDRPGPVLPPDLPLHVAARARPRHWRPALRARRPARPLAHLVV